MIIQLVQEGKQMVLQGCVENAEFKLVRGKDMKALRQAQTRAMPITTAASSEEAGNPNDLPSVITKVLEQYAVVFDVPHSLPPVRALDHHIPLKPDFQPFKLKPYRYPHSQKSEIE